MDTFTLKDSILAKYELSKFIETNKIYFSYKYSVSDAALKYMYILQRISDKIKTMEHQGALNILELGCGDGHLLRIINTSFGHKCTGFDPILKSKRVKFSNLIRDKLKSYGKLVASDHLHFTKVNSTKFDIVYDACSLTHFDTNPDDKINSGWKWAISYLPKIMKPGASFISATDVSEINPSQEFLKSKDLLNAFSKVGKLQNLNIIKSDLDSIYLNHISSFKETPFLRVASAQDKSLLGVLGFEIVIG